MRKNILSLSIATMIGGMGIAHANVIVPTGTPAGATGALTTLGMGVPAGVAAATNLEFAAGGVGHQLITPYFTANGGNATVISIVNTDTVRGKAVKVRFRGAANSDDILDFQVYLSPSDHWSGVVTKNASTGIAQFTTNDNSCTLPALTKGVPQSFITGRLPTYATATDLANGTSEGYIEIFNMADIPSNSTTTSLYQSILHTAGTPRNCASTTVAATLVDATTEAIAAGMGFSAPTTGLMGNWTIINVAQTTTFSGTMTAVRATSTTGVDGYGNYVLFPQNDATAATPDFFTADPVLRTTSSKSLSSVGVTPAAGTAGWYSAAAVTAANYDLPDMSTPYFGAASNSAPLTQAAAVTAALAVKSITNEYSTDPAVNASTDWTFAMPSRRYSVAMVYGASAAAGALAYSSTTVTGDPAIGIPVSAVGGIPTASLPWFYDGANSVTKSADRICVAATSQKFFDRDEGGKTSGAVFSPGNVATFRFCGEDSVTSFGSAPVSVLGAVLATQTTGTSAFVSGWGVVDTTNLGRGLPIMGSAFIKLTNSAASAGVSGTYGITSDHRFSK